MGFICVSTKTVSPKTYFVHEYCSPLRRSYNLHKQGVQETTETQVSTISLKRDKFGKNEGRCVVNKLPTGQYNCIISFCKKQGGGS